MRDNGRICYRYSLAFKQKVVGEVESGKLTIREAHRLYDIGGSQTIQQWIRKFGKNHLLTKVVRVEMRDEKDKLKELEKEKRALESALAQSQLRVISLESLIESVEEHYAIDVKKNFGSKVLKEISGK